MLLDIQKNGDICGHRFYYREVGYYIIYFREQFERAVKYFDEACAKHPDDLRSFIGRSYANGKACHYKEALRDVNRALELDPNNYVCHALKAQNMYLNLKFEDALILNLKSLNYRKKPNHFELGAMCCTEAIENCIGKRVGHPLRNYYKIIRKLAWKMAYELTKPYQPKSKHKKKTIEGKIKSIDTRQKKIPKKIKFSESEVNILGVNMSTIFESHRRSDRISRISADTSVTSGLDVQQSQKEDDNLEIMDSLHSTKQVDFVVPKAKPFPYSPLQRCTTNLKNYMAEKYLGALYRDKIYLEKLEHNLCGVGPNKENHTKIMNMVFDGYKALNFKQEVLRARRPFYFIKYQEATSSGSLKKRQEEELRLIQKIMRDEAENILKNGIYYLKRGDGLKVSETVQKMIDYCDSKTKRFLPEKDEFLAKTYELACLGYYCLKRLNPKQSAADQEKRIKVMFGLPISSVPSNDSIIRQYKKKHVELKKQTESYESRLEQATTNEETAWLNFEIARLHFRSRKLEPARLYCKKCINDAIETENWRWLVNSYILLARIYVLQRNKTEAKAVLNNCVDLVEEYNDRHVLDFLYKCLDVLEKADLEGLRLSKLQEIREKQIIGMLANDNMKGEAAFLFRQMNAMPEHRRLGIIPGMGIGVSSSKDLSKFKDEGKRTASTVSFSKKASSRSGPITMERRRSDGATFLNLVEFHLD